MASPWHVHPTVLIPCVACTAQRGYKVRALTRSAEKARELLGDRDGLEVVIADARQPETLPSATAGVAAVAAVTGTTAFPSKRCDDISCMLCLPHNPLGALLTSACKTPRKAWHGCCQQHA